MDRVGDLVPDDRGQVIESKRFAVLLDGRVQRDDGFVNTIAPQVYKGAGGTLWSSAPVTLS